MGLFTKKQEIVKTEYAPTIAFSKDSAPTVYEKLKGEVELNKLKISQDIGEEHCINMEMCEGLYKQCGLVTGVVDKYVDFIVGPGFFTKCDNERAKKICDDFIRDVNFDTVLRGWLKESLMKGTGFLELGGNEREAPQGLKVLDAKRMFIVRDKFGEVIGYNQAKKNMGTIRANDVISFKPFEIACLRINVVGDDAYGQGIVSPALSYIDGLLKNEKSMRQILKRKANSPIHARIGDVNTQQMPTGEAVSAFATDMEYMTDKTEWATDALVDMKVLDFGKIGDKFDFPINHDLDMTLMTFQVPKVIMGLDVNLAVAPVQLDTWERRAASIQAEAEKIIENQIFKRLLLANGLQIHVEFEWGEPSSAETNDKLSKITELLKIPNLNPALADKLQLELGRLMGFDPKALEPEMEQRRKELEEPQPIVPGKNNPNEHTCTHLQESFDDKDYSLTEWLGFNFATYLQSIVQAVKDEEFKDLRAFTAEELSAGKLSELQVENLRKELIKGFKEGKSIKKIEDAIKENVSPKDLYRIENGYIVFDEVGNPKVQVSADRRPLLMARTETTRMASEGARRQYVNGGVEKYRWISSIGDRTCSECNGLNGMVFESKNPGRMPPLHTNCRCTIGAVVEGFK